MHTTRLGAERVKWGSINYRVLPPRRLRINRWEIKQIYHKYKLKKRGVPPPEPFEPEEQFLDFVKLLDPLAPALPVEGP